MPTTNYLTHQINLKDPVTKKALAVAGWVFVCTAGSPAIATTYNPDSNFVANTAGVPLAITAGTARFAVLDSVLTVDLYIFTAQGQFIEITGVKAGSVGEVEVPKMSRQQLWKVPFSIAQSTTGVEKDTGIDLPQDCFVEQNVGVIVTTLESGKTIDVGTLSSESGGDADGIIDGVSLAAAGLVAAKSAATNTRGALLGGTTLDLPYSTRLQTAKSLSYTLAASVTAAAGFIILPITLAG